ncbi:MAG: hypothetical protein ACRBN8_43290 [Nannocystales bacterium]
MGGWADVAKDALTEAKAAYKASITIGQQLEHQKQLFADLLATVRSRIDSTETRLREIEDRAQKTSGNLEGLDVVVKSLKSLDPRTARLEGEQAALRGRFDGFSADRVTPLETKISNLEGRLGGLESSLKLSTEIANRLSEMATQPHSVEFSGPSRLNPEADDSSPIDSRALPTKGQNSRP